MSLFEEGEGILATFEPKYLEGKYAAARQAAA